MNQIIVVLIIVALIILISFIFVFIFRKYKLKKFKSTGGEFNQLKLYFPKSKNDKIIKEVLPTSTMVLLFNYWFNNLCRGINPLNSDFNVFAILKPIDNGFPTQKFKANLNPIIKFGSFVYNSHLYSLTPNQLAVSARTLSDSFYDLYLILKDNTDIKYGISVCELTTNIYRKISDNDKISCGNNLISFIVSDNQNFAFKNDFKENQNLEKFTRLKVNLKNFNLVHHDNLTKMQNLFNIKYFENKNNVDIFIDFAYPNSISINRYFHQIHDVTRYLINKIIKITNSTIHNKNQNHYIFIIGVKIKQYQDWKNIYKEIKEIDFKLLNDSKYQLHDINKYSNKINDNDLNNKSINLPNSKTFSMDEFIRLATNNSVYNIQIEHSEGLDAHKSNIVEFIMRMLYQDESNEDFNEILEFFGFNNASPIKLMNIDDFSENTVFPDLSSKKIPNSNKNEDTYKRKSRFNINKSNSDKKDINMILRNSVFNKANPELFYQLLKFHNSSGNRSNKNTYENDLPKNTPTLNLFFNNDINTQFNYSPYKNSKRIEYIKISEPSKCKFNIKPCCTIDIDEFDHKNNIIVDHETLI